MRKETIDTYNRGATKFIAEFNYLGPRRADISKAFSYITKNNPKVIELGCGNGRDAQEILKYTDDYLGIDLSENLLAEARKTNPDGNFQLIDFETYEFPQGVDIVFALASLLHSDKEQVAEILKKVHGALHSKGVFFISLKYGEYHEETKTEDTGSRTYFFYTPEEILALAPLEFQAVYTDFQEVRGQTWFTLILQK